MKRIRSLLLAATLALAPHFATAQQTVNQAGPITPGHVPVYVGPPGSQAIIQDSGPAGGAQGPGGGISELNVTAQGPAASGPPFAGLGTGPYGTINCNYDGPVTSAAGYHYLCFSPNAQGGGLMAYGAAGGASVDPMQFIINGVTFQFPLNFSLNGYLIANGLNNPLTALAPVNSSVAGWNGSGVPTAFANSTTVNGVNCQLGGTCAVTATASSITPGSTTIISGTNGDIEYNNAGTLGEKGTTGTGNVVQATSPTVSGLTVTGSLTATSLITASDLAVGAATIANGGLYGATLNAIPYGGGAGTLPSFLGPTTNSVVAWNGSGAPAALTYTNANTPSTLVERDASGNFLAGAITASLTGHSSLDLSLTGGTMSGALTGADGGAWSSSGLTGLLKLTVTPNAGTTQGVLSTETITGSASANYYANENAVTFGNFQNSGSFAWTSGGANICNVNNSSFSSQVGCAYNQLTVTSFATPGYPIDQFSVEANIGLAAQNTTDSDASLFGGNDNVTVTGTGWSNLVGREIDITATQAISGTLSALQIVQAGTSTHHGGTVDAGIFFTNVPGAAAWNMGIYMDNSALASGGSAIITPGFNLNAQGAIIDTDTTTYTPGSNGQAAITANSGSGGLYSGRGSVYDICLQTYSGGAGLCIVDNSPTVALPNISTGTPAASLCIDSSNHVIKKTTAGSCI